MSENKENFALHCPVKNEEARKRLKIKAGFYWVTAKKLSVAVSRCISAMDDAGYDEDDFKKPVRVNLPVVDDLPLEGVFDTEFCNRYEKGGEDGITMMPVLPCNNTSDEAAAATGHDDGEQSETLPENAEKGGSQDGDDDCQECEIPVSTLNLTHRFLHLYLFGQEFDGKYQHHATPEQRKDVIRIEMDMEDSNVQSMLTAVRSHPELDKLTNHHLGRLAESVSRAFTHAETRRISPAEFDKFISTWMKTDYLDQGLLTKEWAKGNCVSEINRTPSGANAGGGNKTDRLTPLTKTGRDYEIALGLIARRKEFDIYNPPFEIDVEANSIMNLNRSEEDDVLDEFIASCKLFEDMPGGMDYSRACNVATVKTTPEGLFRSPFRHREYLNRVMTETDHAHPDELIVDIACGRSSMPMPMKMSTTDDEEKSQPTDTLADEPATSEAVEQEPEKVCNTCGKTGGDNCPDCGAMMGDATYQETFNEENLDESQEKDPEEMEGAEHPHNENAGSDPHRDCSDETGEVADPVIAGDIEPGIYYGISNENYHAGPGVSKSQLDDIADTPALYLWRKNAPVDTTKTKTLDLGTAFHCRVLEPEEFSNRFIVAPEFNRRTTAGKEEEKAFLMECASTGKTVITAEEGRKIELMYQSVMALPLGQWLVESAGYAESSVYWEDPETGILCRCRPDKIIPEFHWIMDVKTTADIQRFKTAYYDYRYHVQDAFYSDGYEAQFGVLPTFVFLVASTTVECGRYPVEIFMMGEEAKLAGQQEYHRNLRTLADCLNTDEWPAIKTLSLPRWAKEYAND
ncbi:PD-(D/E)XK nuclease-like domain-containing protein [Escherichia coli]|uniref:PD-(D/E)XK nuclease-like domain-containing protein n=1 Tax=Escherichia coli TaxID=562 RepID=UPI00191B4B7E|nr:PD-(D/E)XK nuclease-like domain-containing protein [Escherichia coli]CAD6036465.1 exonuclease VIII [Escherichia coli]CAD6098527.1 exonuclease VIII [Escherichia coli]CAD6176725.1 exonuclease VIII [Escherichia coli]